MRVLLTRAPDDAARVRERLEADGHKVLVSPVIESVPMPARWPSGAVDAVLATSAQAFLLAGDLAGPSPEARRLLPLLLVGERTEEAARAAGFLGATHVAPTAASLSREVAEDATRTPGPKRLVYLAGRHRKPDVETALADAGLTVEIVEVYEARAVDAMSAATIAALSAGAIDAVLHFSRRSAAIFLAQAEKAGVDAVSATHLCISDDVAGPLRTARLSKIAVARAPNVPAMLDLVDTI